MAQEGNFFALLGDEEGDHVSKLIDRVNQEEEKKNSAMVKKVQKEKKEVKMTHQIPSDMRAKRLVLPIHVRRSFIVFDKKKEREKAEAAKRKAKEDAKAKGLMENNGDSNTTVAADDKTGEQPMKGNFIALDNSNEGQSTTLNSYLGGHRGGNGLHRRNGGNYNYQRNNGGANVYQQDDGYNGFYEGNYRRANGYQPKNSGQYQGSFKGYNGNQWYNRENNGVSNGEDPNGNVAADGWQFIGRRRRGNRDGTYQEHMTHEQDGIKHDTLEGSKNSEKDSGKSVNGDNNDAIIENKDPTGLQSVENEVEGHLPVTTEGEEVARSEKNSTEGKDGVKSEKKSKKKKGKETQDIFEKKDEKKEEEKKNLMTLEEYEKKKLEDRKSLEALKWPEQRKVEDKDFQSMQLIGKKKKDSQPKSEDKLKKKDKIKEEKVCKTLSIEEFLKPAKGQMPYMRHRWNGDRPYGRRDIESTDRKGNGERHSGRHEGRRPSGQGDGDKPTNGNGYGERERSSGRRDGGRPNGKGDEGRSNGRFGSQRPNGKRDGDRPAAGHGPGPSAPLAPTPPSFDFEHHHFPALRRNGKA
ncbi:hypothetical protein REPUB_Repub17cG0053100 [Reevesia pubescens]